MSQLFSLTFIIATVESFLRGIVNNLLLFLERMLFESYVISSQNNGIYSELLLNYVETNMLSWQTKSYIFQSDPHRLGKLIPGQKILINNGIYFFWYQGKLFWVHLDCRESPYAGFKEDTNLLTFSLKLMSFRWHVDILHKLFMDIDQKSKEIGSSIYSFSNFNSKSWCRVGPLPKRKIETVVLPRVKKDSIIDDLNHFFSLRTRENYEKKGINYKRGIILYGPPGCGKTSLISAISNYFGMDIYNLPLDNAYMNEEGFQNALSRIPGRSIVLFEDIDVAFPRNESDEDKEDKAQDKEMNMKLSPNTVGKSSLTMKAFINGIDGIKSNNNGIVFLFTTNHIEHLDPTILRPGRIDLRIQLTHIQEPEIREMLNLYYTADQIRDDEYSYEQIVNKLKNQRIIPAELSGFLLENSHHSLDKLITKVEGHKWNEHELLGLGQDQVEQFRRPVLCGPPFPIPRVDLDRVDRVLTGS